MAKHNETGSWGEHKAVELLISKGYAITETNWRSGHYETDIVAMHGNRLVFVEVKTRTNREDDPAEAVDLKKMRRMAFSADHYIKQHDLPHDVQFDIISVVGTPNDYKIEHIPDAFLSPLRTFGR